MDRTRLLRSLIDVEGSGLEIGPSYNPLLPKAEGFRVETVDYTDAAGLLRKYAGNPGANLAAIEPVDHVLDGSKSLAEAVGKPRGYDFIVASHVIEHVPDLLGFIQSCEWLLKPDGVLLLAVPDKRHCFDVLQPLTTTGGVLQAHLERRTRPTPGAVFDDLAYNMLRGDRGGWGRDDTGALRFAAGDLAAAAASFDEHARSARYTDVHVWRFVPSGFRLILRDLYEIGKIDLREQVFRESVGNEFYATLSREGQGCPLDRLTLARQSLAEQASVAV